MLTRMGIHNFALIEEMNIDFKPGVTVITGETGAGKSILIDALSILLGDRANSEYIRKGKDKFLIEGIFDLTDDMDALQALQERNVLVEDGELYLSRAFSQNGKGLILANNQAIHLKTVREIAPFLADIHGQYSNQIFLNDESHVIFLDSFTPEGKRAFSNYHKAYTAFRGAEKELLQIDTLSAERERELDILNFQINEIQEANLVLGEDTALAEEIQRMDNYEHLQKIVSGAYEAMENGRNPMLETLNVIRAEIKDLLRFDETLKDSSELIDSAYFQLEEGAHGLANYLDTIAFDEDRYEYCRSRDSLLYGLKKKYGNTMEAIFEYEHMAQKRLEELEAIDYEKSSLLAKVATLNEAALEALQNLSEIRHRNNMAITEALKSSLFDLGMENAVLTFDIEDRISNKALNSLGAEHVELMFSPNKGEGIRPLVKIASGGELSRIALAFSSVFSENSRHTIIFDEIDVGISGDVAIKVAEKIQRLAVDKQVFCITHMPQTVAIADQHLHLNKTEIDGRTVSSVSELTEADHINIIASMISGKAKSATATKIAEELVYRVKGTPMVPN